MKILAIYPGLNPLFDEVTHALPPLVREGCQVQVLATRLSALKSSEQGSDFEDFQGVHIHRLFANAAELKALPPAQRARSEELADALRPDVVFLNSLHALPLGRHLALRFGVPSILRLESADPLSYLRRRAYGGIPAVGRLLGHAYWRHLASQVSALMINDPTDLARLASLSVGGKPTLFAAHCAQQPEGLSLVEERDPEQMIYIGSLTRHKNCRVWLTTVPRLFEQTSVQRFTIIGQGADMPVVDALKARFGKRIEHIAGVTRKEALRHISGAWFAYTESSTGWGFLCDAWSTRTPLLCPRSTFCVIPGWTGIVPHSLDSMVSNVRRLYSDASYYAGLQDGGLLRYQSEHTAAVVGRQYLQILREVATLPPA